MYVYSHLLTYLSIYVLKKCILFFFFFFTAAPVAYRSSQKESGSGAVAAGLHSIARSELHLLPMPQPVAMLGPYPTE